jgi:hypothetical protein
MSTAIITKTILLNALPGAGKSEVRKYLSRTGGIERRERFSIGDIVQIDDYPYVEVMRDIDAALCRLGLSRMFFELPDRGFISDYEWGTLAILLNEDYEDLFSPPQKLKDGDSAAMWMFRRIDRARGYVGICKRLTYSIASVSTGSCQTAEIQTRLAGLLEAKCLKIYEEKMRGIPENMEDKTVVIEFSRGGGPPTGHPLPEPLGYAYTYSVLSPAILENAKILYISVKPETSRARNGARAGGGVLNHRVPDYVMENAYGSDDIKYLITAPGFVPVQKTRYTADTQLYSIGGYTLKREVQLYRIPIVVLENDDPDLTSFARGPADEWKPEDVKALGDALERAFARP